MEIKGMFSFSLISGMVRKRTLRIQFFFFIIIMILVLSCKKEGSFMDLNIIPEDKRMGIGYVDSMVIESYTVMSNPLQTSNPLTNPSFFQTMLGDPNVVFYSIIGSMTDPVFGSSKASFLMQFAQSTFPTNFGTDPKADALILKLSFDAAYGNASTVHTLHVYQLTQYLSDSIAYTSDFDPGGKYGTFDFSGNFKTTFSSSVTEIRIPLNTELGNYLLRADSTEMSTVSNFLSFFNGLYVTSDQITSIGEGSFGVHKLPTDSLLLYYHYTDGGIVKNAVMGYRFYNYVYENASTSLGTKNLTSISMFTHNNQSFDAGEHSIPDKKDSVFFVQGMNGVCPKLVFPDLSSLREKIKNPSSLHYAELIIKADTNWKKKTAYPKPVKLVIAGIGTDNQYHLIDEQINGTYQATLSYNYDSVKAEYRIPITNYIQNYLTMKQDYNQFIIAPFLIIYNTDKTEISSGLFMPSGVVLKKPVLKILYNTF
jgi:hypothetical protein